jgi:hypothetical protein
MHTVYNFSGATQTLSLTAGGTTATLEIPAGAHFETDVHQINLGGSTLDLTGIQVYIGTDYVAQVPKDMTAVNAGFVTGLTFLGLWLALSLAKRLSRPTSPDM